MNIKDERRKLENEIYEVLFKYFPQYETRGLNAHARAQMIAQRVGDEFIIWTNQNLQNGEAK